MSAAPRKLTAKAPAVPAASAASAAAAHVSPRVKMAQFLHDAGLGAAGMGLEKVQEAINRVCIAEGKEAAARIAALEAENKSIAEALERAQGAQGASGDSAKVAELEAHIAELEEQLSKALAAKSGGTLHRITGLSEYMASIPKPGEGKRTKAGYDALSDTDKNEWIRKANIKRAAHVDDKGKALFKPLPLAGVEVAKGPVSTYIHFSGVVRAEVIKRLEANDKAEAEAAQLAGEAVVPKTKEEVKERSEMVTMLVKNLWEEMKAGKPSATSALLAYGFGQTTVAEWDEVTREFNEKEGRVARVRTPSAKSKAKEVKELTADQLAKQERLRRLTMGSIDEDEEEEVTV